MKISLPLLGLFGTFALSENCFAQNENDDQIEKVQETTKYQVMAARMSEVNRLLAKAIALYKHKHWQEAIDTFSQVIRLDPQNASAHFSLAITLEASGQVKEAIDHYQLAHEIEPDHNEYEIALQNAQKKLDKQKEAKFADDKWQILSSQAGTAFKERHYEQALSLSLVLDKEKPDQALTKYNIGTTYLMLKKPNDALIYYKKAHELAPKNGHYEEALHKLESAIKNAKEESPEQTNKHQTNAKIEKSKTPKLVEYYGMTLQSHKGQVIIKSVSQGSRAAQVRLLPKDIIQVIDGLAIKNPQQVEKMLQSKPMKQRFQFLVIRNGRIGQILF